MRKITAQVLPLVLLFCSTYIVPASGQELLSSIDQQKSEVSSNDESKPIYYALRDIILFERISDPRNVIMEIPEGAKIKVIDTHLGDWWKIFFEGQIGFVQSEALIFENELKGKKSNEDIHSPVNLYSTKPTYYVSASANMHITFSEQSTVLSNVPEGVQVKVLNSFFEDWWKVYYEDQIGYVQSKYLSFEKTESVAESKTNVNHSDKQVEKYPYAAKKNTSRYSQNKVHVLIQKTSLRSSADSQSAVLKRLRVGDEVEVLETSDKWWYKVSCEGKEGWVKKQLLQQKD